MPRSPPDASDGGQDISATLEGAKLSKYEAQLRDFGCEEQADLAAMEDSELKGLGMKGPEIRRLRRALCPPKSESTRKSSGGMSEPLVASAVPIMASNGGYHHQQQQPMMNNQPMMNQPMMNQPVMTNNQQVIVAGGHTMLKEPPGCCCKFWFPCCAVFCHEGCTCNLCGVFWIPCFAMCCWVRSLPLAVQPQNHIKVFCCLLIKLFQAIMQRALQQHSLSRSALHH